tara:strand:- start:639 stop:1106 length:468 start_codon:yes stop_codon:yes gene_type:complete
MKIFPSVKAPIIENGKSKVQNLFQYIKNKKIVIFGVPGAFTPTCSERHLPGYLELNDKIRKKGIDDIFCLSVNDEFVMLSWLLTYPDGNKIKGIADGNAEISHALELTIDKSSHYMGLRCSRFAMLVDNHNIINIFIDEPGKFEISSAENILNNI